MSQRNRTVYGNHVRMGRPSLDLDREIARLEHGTSTEMLGSPIAPVGDDPDHCQWCACAAAGHGTVVTSIISDGRREHRNGPRCGECGADLEGLL